jgi:L-amino acid N-acyltransferase YncA
MEVRRATADDAAGIAEVHVRSWQAAYRDLIPDDFLAGLDDTIERRATQWAGAVADPHLDVLVATDGGIVGFALTSPGRDGDLGDHGELQTLYTVERVWGSGLGHALHEAAMDGLRSRGFARALVWVLDGNERMLGFCRAHGWVADGTTKDEDWDDLVLHEVRLVRSL